MSCPNIVSLTLPSVSEKPIAPVLHVWRSGQSNLGYLLKPGASNQVICVDVPNGREILQLLENEDWNLTDILLTHTHHDHVNGLADLVTSTGCRLFAAEPVPSCFRQHVTDGLAWEVEGLRVVAMDTSGHSDADISYLFPDVDLCFCADTLFQWGCGRMFAGPAERLWTSLLRLRSLPDQTLMCCGHDFREDNLAFIQNELSGWSKAGSIIRRIQDSLRSDPVHKPFTIGEQKKTNPFLRADDPDLARVVGRAGREPAEVFKELRKRRNAY